jgi:hypothetical protein
MNLPPPVPIDQLVIGQDYMIEVPKVTALRNLLLERGKNPTFSGITIAKYLGKKVHIIEPFINEEGEEDEYEYFVINNYYDSDNKLSSDNEKLIQLKNEDVMLKFIRPPTYNPYGENILLDNAIDYISDRKWRLSRSHNLEIPEEAAKEDLVFYRKVDSTKRALVNLFNERDVRMPYEIMDEIDKISKNGGRKKLQVVNKSKKNKSKINKSKINKSKRNKTKKNKTKKNKTKKKRISIINKKSKKT